MSAVARNVVALCAVSAVLLVLPLTASAECPEGMAICGTVYAEEATDPVYEGYWEYCAEIEWNTTEHGGHGLSHTDVLLALEACVPAACEEGVFVCPDPAGEGEGEGGCTVYYCAEFECEGDPLLPEYPFPTMKFEPYEDECEPGEVGTATLCFYSLFEPAPWNEYSEHVAIKFGQNVATGRLEGELPACPIPVEAATWAHVKSLYR
jgi:hypothetical protein